jgi:uncharacterized protein YciI
MQVAWLVLALSLASAAHARVMLAQAGGAPAPAAPSAPVAPSAPAAPSAPSAPAAPAAVAPTPSAATGYDAALAARVGADQRGMRAYVLVILKTGPTPVPKGPKRDAMFAGHFANIARLAKAGKLALAGPFEDNADGWRGLYLFAVDDVAAAKALTDTDPVVASGEMVAEFHPWYGSAAAMLLPEMHRRLQPPAK